MNRNDAAPKCPTCGRIGTDYGPFTAFGCGSAFESGKFREKCGNQANAPCQKCGEQPASIHNYNVPEWECGSIDWPQGFEQSYRCQASELQSQVKAWADAALASLAGLTPTPEHGYLKDGGVEQFKADAARMRREIFAAMKTESAWYLWSPTAQTVVVTPEQMLTLDEAAEQIAALAAK